MFNICPGCGEYSDEKEIDLTGPFAICKQCGYRHRFIRLPLLIVTGASGTGKTTIAMHLAPLMTECVCMESDILWRDEFNKPDNDYLQYRNLWLRVAKNISQAGRPVVLIGSATPGQFENCNESRYFSRIEYLALICNKEQLVQRLKARPNWRKSGSEETVNRMVNFNQWLIDNAQKTKPPMTILDTTSITVEEAVQKTKDWITKSVDNTSARS